MSLLLLFAAQFVNIFLRAFQQRNVAHMHYIPILPISTLMALTEVFVIGTIAIQTISNQIGWEEVAALALGGGTGCIVSMYLHNKVFK